MREFDEFERAWKEFILATARSLRLDKLLDWLASRMSRA